MPDPVQPTRTADTVIEHRSIRQRRGRGRARIAVNLTTMIDVTFLLLIYFMVATKFRVGEEVFRLDLPQNLQSNQQADPFELDEQPLRISITTPAQFINRYELYVDGWPRQPETFDELFERLRDLQIKPQTSTGLYFPDHPIIIEPARAASWGHTVGAFNAATKARYTNIKFAKPI